MKRLTTAPGYSLFTAPRIMREFVKRPLQFMETARQTYGDIVRYRLGPYLTHQISHPDYFHYVLQLNNKNYAKAHVLYDEFKPIVGNGLLTSEGAFWRRQRRLAQPIFRHENIAAFVSVFVEQAATLMNDWEALARSREPFDITKEMMRLTFGIVGRALFSQDISAEAKEIGVPITIGLDETSHRADTIIFKLPLSIPTPRNTRLNQAMKKLNKFVFGMIDERRKQTDRPVDLLTMLIDTTDDESNEQMTDGQLRDELMTFLLAGHETTAIALSWTCYLLCKYPEVAARMRDECQTVLNGRTLGYDDLGKLVYTRSVLEESMRLYPPFWVIGRTPLKDDSISGFTIPAKSIVLLPIYLVHRHPDFWDNPSVFDPDRFMPEAAASYSRHAYFPFGGGQRQCIGTHFASIEAQIILATIVQRYRLKLAERADVEVEPHVTLRAKGGIRMRLNA